jgi:hypothetical protein
MLFLYIPSRCCQRRRHHASLDGQCTSWAGAWKRVFAVPDCYIRMVWTAYVIFLFQCRRPSLNHVYTAHFSENWGYLSMSPMFAGNLFSVAFGRNLDSHGTAPSQTDLLGPNFSPQCLQGRLCYVDTLYMTMAACFLSMVLSVWAGWRDRKKIAASQLKTRAEVI